MIDAVDDDRCRSLDARRAAPGTVPSVGPSKLDREELAMGRPTMRRTSSPLSRSEAGWVVTRAPSFSIVMGSHRSKISLRLCET